MTKRKNSTTDLAAVARRMIILKDLSWYFIVFTLLNITSRPATIATTSTKQQPNIFVNAFTSMAGIGRTKTVLVQQQQRRTCLKMSSNTGTGSLLDIMSEACTKNLGRDVKLEPASGGGYSGGGGASTSAAIDSISGTKYFIKTASASSGGTKMLKAEYMGVKEMSDTNTIKVPTPIAYGEGGPLNQGFVVFEYLNLGGSRASQRELGRQLAQMHKHTSSNGKYGFHIDNTIGATPQPNLPWYDTWSEFWDVHRLGYMLKLTGNAGLSDKDVTKLREKTKQLLSQHQVQPSLLHGDLWGGNQGSAKLDDGTVVPCIFDPATYYGDREADIAMTHLFGGFSSDFYQGYDEEWPLEDGYQQRENIYNLYHILNHEVLFGGGYLSQARGMIQQILRM